MTEIIISGVAITAIPGTGPIILPGVPPEGQEQALAATSALRRGHQVRMEDSSRWSVHVVKLPTRRAPTATVTLKATARARKLGRAIPEQSYEVAGEVVDTPVWFIGAVSRPRSEPKPAPVPVPRTPDLVPPPGVPLTPYLGTKPTVLPVEPDPEPEPVPGEQTPPTTEGPVGPGRSRGGSVVGNPVV